MTAAEQPDRREVVYVSGRGIHGQEIKSEPRDPGDVPLSTRDCLDCGIGEDCYCASPRRSSGNTLVIDVDGVRQTILIGDPTMVIASEVNAAIQGAFPGVPAASLPRVLTSEEAAQHQVRYEANHRPALLRTIRSFPEDEVNEALKDMRRKGWGLDGLSTENLERLASGLVGDANDAADW